MAEIWVTSDTHFGHRNVINYCGRPFANEEIMDECLIENWNSVVKPGDKVYHLGDVYFGQGFEALKYLNGKKRLILGNHDDAKSQYLQKYFQKIYLWRMFPEFGLLMTHVPVHETTLYRGPTGNEKDPPSLTNIHGHTHQNRSPAGRYQCVCVEQTDYTPVNIETLRRKW